MRSARADPPSPSPSARTSSLPSPSAPTCSLLCARRCLSLTIFPSSASPSLTVSSAVRRRGAAAAAVSPSPSSASVSASLLSSTSASAVLGSSSFSPSSPSAWLRWLEGLTGVPSVYFAVALLLLLLLMLLHGWGMRALTFVIGFLYPLHRSLRALASAPHRPSSHSSALTASRSYPPPSAAAGLAEVREEQRLWLIYWMVFGLFSFTERLSDSVLWWLPLYQPVKLAFLLWCFLPQSQGCATLYDVFLQPLLSRHREGIERGVGEVTEVIGVVGAHVIRSGRKASLFAASVGGELLSNLAAASPSSQPRSQAVAQAQPY